jgi:protein disulfide-isomerase A1
MLARFLLVLVWIALALAAIPTEEGVLVLDDGNFDDALKENSLILVEFYAPWCGHCKALAPEYAKAAQKLAAQNSPVKLAKVDATEAKDLGTRFQVQGFPTLKFFRDGKPSEYQGGRTEAEIVSWVTKKSGPVAIDVVTEEDLQHLKEANDAFALGVFSSADSPAAKAFLSVANEVDTISFAITTSDAVKASLGTTGETVVILKTFDDKRNDLAVTDATTVDEIRLFTFKMSVPLIQTFTQESSQKIFKSPIQKHTLFFTDTSAPHHEPTTAAFSAAALEFRGETMFINVPHTEARVLEYFGITEKDLPTAVLGDMSGEGGQMKKYPFKGPYETAAISDFLKQALSGALKPTLKSEAVAPEDLAAPVKVIKGESFADIVLNNSNDVFVEFYAPWCGHCKKLAPIWDELAEKYKNVPTLTIAKMDATANEIDVEGVQVRGFPTLYFFPGNDKTKAVKYDEGRELDDLVKYLKANVHHKHDEL